MRATRGREREDRDDARAREEFEARKKEVMVLIGEEGYVWLGCGGCGSGGWKESGRGEMERRSFRFDLPRGRSS